MKNKVILLASDQLGNGEKELGEGILETFFTILKQKEELPVAVFCMNSGVFTLTEESLVSLQLADLEGRSMATFFLVKHAWTTMSSMRNS